MPIIRKIIEVGKSSRAVILPKSWLTYFETREGCSIDKVIIQVNEELRITPYICKSKPNESS